MLFNNQITLDGHDYEIVIIDGNIVLQGKHRDLELEYGWLKLMDECNQCIRYNMRDHGVTGTPPKYLVWERAYEGIHEYVSRNYKDAVIVEHNLN